MQQWFERHAQTLVGSVGRLWQHPFATLLTILVIGIALALPACLHLLVQNVREASGGWSNALDISIYMKQSATLAQAEQAAERIRKRRDVDEVTVIKADDALRGVPAQFGLRRCARCAQGQSAAARPGRASRRGVSRRGTRRRH